MHVSVAKPPRRHLCVSLSHRHLHLIITLSYRWRWTRAHRRGGCLRHRPGKQVGWVQSASMDHQAYAIPLYSFLHSIQSCSLPYRFIFHPDPRKKMVKKCTPFTLHRRSYRTILPDGFTNHTVGAVCGDILYSVCGRLHGRCGGGGLYGINLKDGSCQVFRFRPFPPIIRLFADLFRCINVS